MALYPRQNSTLAFNVQFVVVRVSTLESGNATLKFYDATLFLHNATKRFGTKIVSSSIRTLQINLYFFSVHKHAFRRAENDLGTKETLNVLVECPG